MFILIYFLQAVAVPVIPDTILVQPQVVCGPVEALEKKEEQQVKVSTLGQNGEKKQAAKLETESKTRTVTLKTNISKEMTSYKYGAATYIPEFTLKADDLTVPLTSSIELCLKNNECLLSYDHQRA
ncbi:hypothetical protein IPH67_01065 [bacterium]|nr:MAG: hypothetical protein IPH67_01065 [bacterium]